MEHSRNVKILRRSSLRGVRSNIRSLQQRGYTMKKEEYRSLLGQLPIKRPTLEEITKLCPHLTAEQATQTLLTDGGYVACPPLRIRGAFQIISYHREWIEAVQRVAAADTRNYPPYLDHYRAGRTPASYADGMLHGDMSVPYAYIEKAIQFAEDSWGDDLILDDWVSVADFYLQDPTDLVNDRYHKHSPRTKVVLYVAFNRYFNSSLDRDDSVPESELFDAAIVHMTVDRFVRAELVGGRGAALHYNCAHCGAGLMPQSCTGCGKTFDDDGQRGGWSTPLSKKMVAFLQEQGHTIRG